MTLEATRAADLLHGEGIGLDVIDIRTLNPFDDGLVLESVRRTGLLLVADTGSRSVGFAAAVVSRVAERCFSDLVAPPVRVTLPDVPTPTTRALSNYYYPTMADIANAARRLVGKEGTAPVIRPIDLLDAPDASFTGPF